MTYLSCSFFRITVICMSLFAFTLDGTKEKTNWLEQFISAIAQRCFLLDVLNMLF